MSEAIAIDDSVLQPLGEIRRREAALREFLARTEQAKTKVSDAVYRKVTEDYRKRLASLEQEAAGLHARARAEYQKLATEYEQLAAPEDEARFAVEELELRHLVGEINDEEFAEARRQPAAVIERCRGQREALDRMKVQFLQVLDVDEARVIEQPPDQAAEQEISMPTLGAAIAGGADAISTGAGAAPAADHPPAGASAPSRARTATAVAEVPPSPEYQTTILPLGFLTIVEGPGAPAEFVLADTTYIGRGEDCHVRIAHPTVSRHHAIVAGSRDGYRIRDLGSQNGTLVNGEPAAGDRLLADRDEILIGEALLVFSRDRSSRLG